MSEPTCAGYDVWVGLEIEGKTDLRVPTVFVRSMKGYPESLIIDPYELSDYLLQHEGAFYRSYVFTLASSKFIPRIWFCKEFRDWGFIESCADSYEKVCIEFTKEEFLRGAVPPTAYLRDRSIPYVKMGGQHSDYFTRPGAHYFFGQRFAEESYMIKGKGDVEPHDYESDIPIRRELLC